ncbi:MAG: hypothetical protein MCSN_1750 [Candidatus Microsyncoccus archaeolyticus]|nr:MAG: hypothetical protein MCSN_1750 [Candidatus Parcubacteria bacterium]
MTNKYISLINSAAKISDRTSDGNLIPEARERILKSVKEYLENTGRANISEMSHMLGLSRQTTKNIVDEILDEWKEGIQSQTLIQSKWIESTLKEMDQSSRLFSKEKIAMINLKSSLLTKLNALQKLALKEESYGVNIYLVKRNELKELPDAKPP